MADDKDQNLDAAKLAASGQTADAEGEAFDVSELDQIIAQEDPQFLAQVSEIKISATHIDLSVMDEALRAANRPVFRWKDKIRELFSYADNPRQFIKFWSSILVIVIFLGLTWGLNKNMLNQKLFLTSFAEFGDTVRDYNPNTETEAFYDNPKFSKNIMTVSKMFVNLQTSENSGPNPMLAIEVNVEGLSADAIIEVKDREAEFKDQLLRYTEEKNYDELTTAEGKQSLCESYKQIINSNLTRGQVRKVLLNSFIIKP